MSLTRWGIAAGIALGACAPAAPERQATGRDDLRLSSPRAVHASVVLSDGRVMLIGGCAVDGCDPGPGSSTADLVDPRSGAVVRTVALASPRIGAAAIRLADGRVLIVGGWGADTPSAEAELFDPATGLSRRLSPMGARRADVSAVGLVDGRVLVAGGFDGRDRLGSAEIFDPAAEAFVPTGSMAVPRSGAAPVRLRDGRVLLVGGAVGPSGDVRPTSASEIFDPRTGQFAPAPPLIEARYKHAALLLASGDVLVVAGSDERDYRGKKKSLEILDLRRNAFRSAGELRSARFKLAGSVLLLPDGRVLVAGGASRPEIYDPATRRSEETAIDLGGTWSFMTADRLADGRILVAGGYGEGSIEVSDRLRLLRP